MSKPQMPISEFGLDDLAGVHLKNAVDRLGKLVDHEDGQIALEASQIIIQMARPSFLGWRRPWPGDPWGGPWDPSGGFRAG